MMCRHCGTRKSNRPRGLCWACYYSPGLKDQYPSESKFGSRKSRGLDDGDFFGEGKPAAEPVKALPGTLGKLQALAERAARGEQLWHPGDETRLP